jgi:predicted protein tyrosine phosphatase
MKNLFNYANMYKEPIKIFVMSKIQFNDILKMNNITDDNVDELIHSAFISINDFKGSFYHKPLFLSSHHNVLTLFFDDIEKDLELSPTNHQETKAFSKDDAIKIIKFLDDNKSVKTLLIHCAAGISRSGAVGLFTLSYLNGDKEHFNKENKYILPNARVSRLLNNEINGYV